MIIWAGHGILIPLLGILGAVLGGLMGSLLHKAGLPWSMVVLGAVWGAALAVFYYARTIGKTVTEDLLDPKTGQMKTVVLKKHSLFFIPARLWSIIGLIGAGLLSIPALLMPDPGELGSADAAPKTPFDQANSLITSTSGGVAHGNTAVAEKLAEQFSTTVKKFRDLGIENGKAGEISLTDDSFLTYCQLSEEGCAFLVHVPKFRKYNDEAKEFIAQAAWMSAQFCVAELEPKPKKLAVGLRGVVFYDRVWIGRPDSSMAGEPEDSVLERHQGTSAREALKPFFDIPALAPVGVSSTTEAEPNPEERDEPTVLTQTEAQTEPLSKPAPLPEPTPESEPVPTPKPIPAPEPVLPTEIRGWKAPDGRVMKAAVVRFTDATGTAAEFRREDGQVFTLTLDKFASDTQVELFETSQALEPAG